MATPTSTLSLLDRAHAEINALSGWHDPKDERAAGRNETVDAVLAIIERLGGRDPHERPEPRPPPD